MVMKGTALLVICGLISTQTVSFVTQSSFPGASGRSSDHYSRRGRTQLTSQLSVTVDGPRPSLPPGKRIIRRRKPTSPPSPVFEVDITNAPVEVRTSSWLVIPWFSYVRSTKSFYWCSGSLVWICHWRSHAFWHPICCYEGLTITSGSFLTFGTWCYSLPNNRGIAIFRAVCRCRQFCKTKSYVPKEVDVGKFRVSRPNLEFAS